MQIRHFSLYAHLLCHPGYFLGFRRHHTLVSVIRLRVLRGDQCRVGRDGTCIGICRFYIGTAELLRPLAERTQFGEAPSAAAAGRSADDARWPVRFFSVRICIACSALTLDTEVLRNLATLAQLVGWPAGQSMAHVVVGTAVFTDPDDYRAGFRGAKVDLVFTGRGDFKARLTWLELPNLHLLRSQESLPRIAYVSLLPNRVFVAFQAHLEAPIVWGGVEQQPGDIVFHSEGECTHERTRGSSHWAFISLAPEYFVRYAKALAGRDLLPPLAGQILRPPASAVAHLRRLHARACRLAETKPKVAAHGQVARALEQDMIHVLVDCLTAGLAGDDMGARKRHADIMSRFEGMLALHFDRQLQVSQICAFIKVSERTLRLCCHEFLEMSPSRYIRLRRLNLVRAALRQADPSTQTVAETARRYGFLELGRFAVVYREVFGESPSATLRAAPTKSSRSKVDESNRCA
jgi:AraC-like DNA-binding protein